MVNDACSNLIKTAWRAKGSRDNLENIKEGLAECKQQLMIRSSKIGGKEKMIAVKKKLKWAEKA